MTAGPPLAGTGARRTASLTDRKTVGALRFGGAWSPVAALTLCLLLLLVPAADAKRMIVFGFDGLDPDVLEKYIEQGRLPNLAAMAKQGQFEPLGTSIPPQSPVAWSNFITGMDAGGHGIFDFLHRDTETMFPYLSTSKPSDAKEPFALGKYLIPTGTIDGGYVSVGGYDMLRYGKPFWETLEENGVPCMIVRMPANFPVTGTASFELSGMSTPDVRGTYGTFSYWTNDPEERGMKIGGGNVYGVRVRRNKVSAKFEGPSDAFVNPKKSDGTTRRVPKSTCEFTVHVDPDEPYVMIDIDGQQVVLKEGEWSPWVGFNLSMSLYQKIPVQAIFYLKEVRPNFKLYASPMNFDSMNPAIPLEHPKGFAKSIAENAGRFYTQGFPEDTKALEKGILSQDQFLEQAAIAGDELLDQFPYVLDRWEQEFGTDNGFLFYYTGNLDQISHMMYQHSDPEHPQWTPDQAGKYGDMAGEILERLDDLVGMTRERVGPDVPIVIMSDHGFASWRRAVNLNNWLVENGYLTLKSDRSNEYLLNTDWAKTKAYGLGINGIYINERGREKNGIVDPADKRALLEELAAQLVNIKDPENGQYAITKVYISEDAFHDEGQMQVGPDLIIGYAKHYRCANAAAGGDLSDEMFADNMDPWGADHCMDHTVVEGTLLSSHPLAEKAPNLQSLAHAILAEFGIGGFPGGADQLKAVGYIAPNEPGEPNSSN